MKFLHVGGICVAVTALIVSYPLSGTMAGNTHHGNQQMNNDNDNQGDDDDDGGMPPNVCDGLEEGAFGLCNAFCNAQDCPAHPEKNSCQVLRRNFERQIGMSTFP